MKSAYLFPLVLGFALMPVRADDFKKLPDKPVDLSHDKNLYAVGYAHLDTQWRWIYPQTIQDFIRNTMEQNFLLFDKYPNYIFNFSGSRRYEFMKEYYPDDYEKVKQYVASGQWAPAGSSVDEDDANVPSLESMERQFLYGNHFFQREFGKASEDFMLPDCFGFPACLPTVLAHGGIKGFSTQKLTWGSAVGIPFNIGTWVGPDGSSIIAALNPGAYVGLVTEDLSQSQMWLKRINDTGDKSGVYADYHYFGTGDRGGAPKESSVEWIERSVAGTGPVRVIPARSDQMFKDITPEQAAKLPSYKGELELINHSAGSITSQAYMKRWNRKNEQLANAAESAAVTASWLGAFPYPGDALYRAWDLVLGSQMHDILPGTSVPKAYEFSWNDEVLTLNQFASVAQRASAAVISTLDTSAQGVPVAVYNPLAIEREDPVEADINFVGAVPEAVTAYDPQGNPEPTQILGHEGGALRVLFIAKVPSIGYAVYDLRPGASPASASALTITTNSLENARYRVTVNDAGDIASVFDKSLNRELLSAPARLSFHYENPSIYPAWNMDWEDQKKPARDFVHGPATIRIVENGPARVALEVERTTENSIFKQQIRLAAGSAGDRVEILDRMDWRSFECCLKNDFSFTSANPNATFDDKVGVVSRGNNATNHFELAQQQWMDLTDKGGDYGVSVLNDSKFACDKPDDNTLRLTLVYTPGTRGGKPDEATQDQGRHEILYALAAHNGDWVTGRTAWQAARLNQPLRAFLPPAHTGPLGKTFSLLSVNTDQVQVTAVKKAEDSDETIIRVKELSGQPATGCVLHFASAITAAREVDGQERPIGEENEADGRQMALQNATLTDGALTFDMKGFGIRAFALKLAAAPASIPAITSQAVPLTYDTDVVSSRAKRTDGAMDQSGGAYPAEMFPAQLTQEGVDFQLGPTVDGANNALSAHGQNLDLPDGFNRVHLLVAADGDAAAQIKIGDAAQPFVVPNWTGFIGQWDNRIWDPSETGLEHALPPTGLKPGFIKRTPVAWYATHHNTPDGDAYYQFSYLFEVSYDLPAGAKTLTLPDDSKIRVFAVSVSHEPAAAPAAAPLYDTLADHQFDGAPIIPQDGQTFTDSTKIILLPTLYYLPHQLHYTLDGSDPTMSSPVYEGPFFASDTVNLAVREINADGTASEITRGTVTVRDQTPPQLLNVLGDENKNTLDLKFSEPLSPATATDPGNYKIKPATTVSSVTQSPDGWHVTLTLGAALTQGTAYTVTVHGLKDTSPAGNVIAPVTRPFNARNIVYTLKSAQLPARTVNTTAAGLPVQKADHWTINLLVKSTVKPVGGELIAGFGQIKSDTESPGGSRYFAVYPDGLRFWMGGDDVKSGSPLDLNRWQMLTAVYDGTTLTLYKDGETIEKRDLDFSADADTAINVGAIDPWDHRRQFEGAVRNFTIRRVAMTDDEVKKLYDQIKPAK